MFKVERGRANEHMSMLSMYVSRWVYSYSGFVYAGEQTMLAIQDEESWERTPDGLGSNIEGNGLGN